MPSSPLAPDLFLQFIRRLEQSGIEYMVSGSIAAKAYGQPRLTTHIDLIVYMDFPAAVRLSQLFPSNEFYFPPVEIVAGELTRELRGHFAILHMDSGFKADVYLRGHDPLRIWALQRVRRMQIADANVRMAPPEYVIIRKLEFFREGRSEKHLRDIRMMLETSRDQINMQELDSFILDRSLQEEWGRAQSISM